MPDVAKIIEVLLKEYTEKLIIKATYHSASGNKSPQLKAQIKTSLKSANTPVNHFTLSDAVLAHNQLAFVLATCVAREGAFKGVKLISLEKMNRKKFNDMLIRNFTIEFSKEFQSSEPFQSEITMSNHEVKSLGSGFGIYLDMNFDFSDGRSHGTSSGVIKIDSEDCL